MRKLNTNYSELLINILLYLTILVMPLIVVNFSNEPRYVIGKVVFIYVANLIGAILLIVNGKFKFKKEHIIAIFFLITILIAAVFSPYGNTALIGSTERREGFTMFFSYAFLFFLSSNYLKVTEKTLDLILIVGSISGIYGILQFFGIDPIQKWALGGIAVSNSIGTIGNRNFFSSYICLFLFLSMALYILKGKIKYFIYSLVLFAALICSMTRGGWVAFIAVAIIGLFFIIKRKKSLIRAIIVGVCFAIIVFTLNYTSNGEVTGRVDNLKEQITTQDEEVKSTSSASSRMDILKMTIKAFKDSPCIGTGPDTLGFRLHRDYFEDIQNHIQTYGQDVDKAHNEYLEHATSSGISTLIFYLILLFMIVVQLIQRRKEDKYIIILLPIIGYMVQAFTNISVPMVAPLFWILLGYAVKEIYKEEEKGERDYGRTEGKV